MKKPKKKKHSRNEHHFDAYFIEGYNEACDDWEKFLHDSENVEEIIKKIYCERLNQLNT